jgi:hypothetical protein
MILEQLKEKYFLGMLTNGASDLQWFKIHNSGIEDLFDTITVSGDHGVGKPQKEIFAIAQEKFSGTATKVIMIGNSLSSDIQGPSTPDSPASGSTRRKNLPGRSSSPRRSSKNSPNLRQCSISLEFKPLPLFYSTDPKSSATYR